MRRHGLCEAKPTRRRHALRDARFSPQAEPFKTPYCKSHMNGTSALFSGLFGLNLPAGSEMLVDLGQGLTSGKEYGRGSLRGAGSFLAGTMRRP